MTPAHPEELDLRHLQSWIGREEITSGVATSDLVRKFYAALDLEQTAIRDGDVAPRLIHFCLAQPVVSTARLGDDGHPIGGFLPPPVALPRRMWAGGNITFHGDIHIGDNVKRISRIADVSVKDGRTGLLCFVSVEHALKVMEKLLVEERQDIVYRKQELKELGRDQPPAAKGHYTRRMHPSTPLLFRYSALTFNSHRIHYDRRHAMIVEGYSGLVVHGPLQATLLLNFASGIHGAPPRRFVFRSLSPIFDDDVFYLHADYNNSSLKLWTAREGGPVAMTGEAHWD